MYINFCDMPDDLIEQISDKTKTLVSLMSGADLTSKYQREKIINYCVGLFDFAILEEAISFFDYQELYEASVTVQMIITKQTLSNFKKLFNQ